MTNLWMAIAPGPWATRVIAMTGPSETILKARLLRQPSHPRALATLLEALALWQGTKVHAALVAEERDGGSDLSLYREAFTDRGGPLYTLDWLPAEAGRRRHPRDVGGVGDFADLRRAVLFEVGR